MNFTVPHGLARRLAMPVGEVWARKDAALIARIYRRVPLDGDRNENTERRERNGLARGNARRSLRLWKAQQVK